MNMKENKEYVGGFGGRKEKGGNDIIRRNNF